MDLADAFAAPLRTDRHDGLWADRGRRRVGVAPGPGLLQPGEPARRRGRGRGVYYSRSRKGCGVKGETSGATQELLRSTPTATATPCASPSASRRRVLPSRTPGPAGARTGAWPTCAHARRAGRRRAGGLVHRAAVRRPDLLRAKLIEEAGELAAAKTTHEVIGEAADVLYFALVAMAGPGRPGRGRARSWTVEPCA